MSGTKTKRAGRPGATWMMPPPISKNAASQILGVEISEDAWGLIEGAFLRFGENEALLSASKTSKKKDDPQGWLARKNATISAIDAALAKVQRVRSSHGGFLHEASENYALQTFGRSADPQVSARCAIDRAFSELAHAVTIIERAEAREIECLTAAAARDRLVVEISHALKSAGICTTPTNGWSHDAIDRPSRFSDLNAFEKLLVQMDIGGDKKPRAFSEWLRELLTGGK